MWPESSSLAVAEGTSTTKPSVRYRVTGESTHHLLETQPRKVFFKTPFWVMLVFLSHGPRLLKLLGPLEITWAQSLPHSKSPCPSYPLPRWSLFGQGTWWWNKHAPRELGSWGLRQLFCNHSCRQLLLGPHPISCPTQFCRAVRFTSLTLHQSWLFFPYGSKVLCVCLSVYLGPRAIGDQLRFPIMIIFLWMNRKE